MTLDSNSIFTKAAFYCSMCGCRMCIAPEFIRLVRNVLQNDGDNIEYIYIYISASTHLLNSLRVRIDMQADRESYPMPALPYFDKGRKSLSFICRIYAKGQRTSYSRWSLLANSIFELFTSKAPIL